MRRIFFLLPLLIFACDDPTGPGWPSVEVPWTEGQSVVCFGTSLTYGYLGWFEPVHGLRLDRPPVIPATPVKAPGATDADTVSYPYHIGLKLRLPVYNEGIVGATTEDALQAVDSVLRHDPALVLLEFGANDFLRSYDVASVEQRLDRLIDTLQAAGTVVVLVSFINEQMITGLPPDHYMTPLIPVARAYLAMLRGLAAGRGILFVEWAMKGIYWNSALLSDPIHPNRTGYRMMADNVYEALEPTFGRNGMLK